MAEQDIERLSTIRAVLAELPIGWRFRLRLRIEDASGHPVPITDCLERPTLVFLDTALAPGMNVVVIGQRAGPFTVYAGAMVSPHGRVVAIAEDAGGCERLYREARLNGLDNVVVLQRSDEDIERSIQEVGMQNVDLIRLSLTSDTSPGLEDIAETVRAAVPLVWIDLDGAGLDRIREEAHRLDYSLLGFDDDATHLRPVGADGRVESNAVAAPRSWTPPAFGGPATEPPVTSVASPYLSVVVAGRNDDHGGGFLQRMQFFVDGLASQCRRFGLDTELVIVEWNPPANKPTLAEALDWPSVDTPLSIRIIDVPAEVHQRLRHHDEKRLYQMLAKNVGIRRAKGKFVLASNIDILFSNELMELLARRRLDDRRFYRATRHDVRPLPRKDSDVDSRLEHCAGHVVTTLHRQTFGWIWVVKEWARKKARGVRIQGRGRLDLAAVERRRTRLRAARHWWEERLATVPLHVMAAGDFTLMSRRAWFALRAYPELEWHALHLDAAMVYFAHYSGLREVTLSEPIYHLDHERSEGDSALPAALMADGQIPTLTWELFERWAIKMRRLRRPLNFNDDDWGFALDSFAESTPGSNASR